MDLVASLRLALADTFALYFMAHSFHWNVRGPLFQQLHDLFGGLYGDVHGAVDDLAERIRTLDALAPASLQEIVAGSSISFGPVPSAMEMVMQLAVANQAASASLTSANDAAAAAGNDGLANFLQERLDVHAKWGWKLKATLADDTAA